MALKLKYGWLEVAIASSCLALVVLGVAFSQTEGLLAGENTDQHVREYNSTGSDDDVCVLASVLIFGFCLLSVGCLPSLERFDFLKSAVFTSAWLLQLLALNWIEVGSIVQTIRSDHNTVLLLWTMVFALSPALVWGATTRRILRIVKETGERQIAI